MKLKEGSEKQSKRRNCFYPSRQPAYKFMSNHSKSKQHCTSHRSQYNKAKPILYKSSLNASTSNCPTYFICRSQHKHFGNNSASIAPGSPPKNTAGDSLKPASSSLSVSPGSQSWKSRKPGEIGWASSTISPGARPANSSPGG